MDTGFRPTRRNALRVGAALVGAALSAIAGAHSTPLMRPAQPLAHVEVYDRATGSTLSVYQQGGRQYIIGVPGHEYAIRIRNTTGQRILAVSARGRAVNHASWAAISRSARRRRSLAVLRGDRSP